jgi:uncharacterized protein YciI
MRFAIIYSQGSAWNTEKPLEEQQGITEHVEHLQGLFDVKTLLIGGPFTDSIGAVAIIKADDLAAAQSVATHDPLVVNHVLQATVHPMHVLFEQQTEKK